MNLLQRINGDLLRTLSGGGTSSPTPSDVASSVTGKGTGASFDSSGVDISVGLDTAARAFSASFVRLSNAVSEFDRSRAHLSVLSGIAADLKEIAKRASENGLALDERARLNTRFQELAGEFRTAQNDAVTIASEEDQVDFLAVDDVEKMLEDAGIDPGAATKLSESFRRLGGTDGVIGFERIISQDVIIAVPGGTQVSDAPEGKSDPLDQDLLTRAGAIRAFADISALSEKIEEDVDSIDTIFDELGAAIRFSLVSLQAFGSITSSITAGGPEAVAAQIVSAIRSGARDSSLGAHSGLDTKLTEALLNPEGE